MEIFIVSFFLQNELLAFSLPTVLDFLSTIADEITAAFFDEKAASAMQLNFPQLWQNCFNDIRVLDQ